MSMPSTTDFHATNNPAIMVDDWSGKHHSRTDYPVRWTAFLEYGPDGDIEEIDLDARRDQDTEAVRDAAQFLADRDYEKGVTHIRVEQRFGLYL